MTDEMVQSDVTATEMADASEVEGEARPKRVRPVKLPDNLPTIVGVAPEDVMKVLGSSWRSAAGHDAPTLHQLIEHGVAHVDVDLRAGYLSVRTNEDSFRAIGVRRELVLPLVAMITGRRVEDVAKTLGNLPGRVEGTAPAHASTDVEADADADVADTTAES